MPALRVLVLGLVVGDGVAFSFTRSPCVARRSNLNEAAFPRVLRGPTSWSTDDARRRTSPVM